MNQTLSETNHCGKLLKWPKYCTTNLTNGEDAANILTAVALRLEVSDSNDVVLYQAVVANVVVNGRDFDQLRAHFCIGSNSWKKEAWGVCAAGFSADHLHQMWEKAHGTCSVLGLREARRLVVDVFQLNLDFKQAWVAGRVQGSGPPRPLTPGLSPAPVAGCFDDDGVDRDLLPVQVLVQPEFSVETQAKISISVSACRKMDRMRAQSYEALKGFLQKW